jgi:phosphoenolpyruvate---glycerone phosphotransferase subunit DhaM
MIGIVVVSHSPALARAAVDLAQQMVAGAGPVVEIAAGAAGRLGTDATDVAQALRRAASPDGVLVLMDLGSAVLSAELALELAPVGGEVRLCPAPLVEGLVAAVVRAAGGAALDVVAREAEAALLPKTTALAAHAGAGPRAPSVPVEPGFETACARASLVNQHGLHARPAAQIAAAVGALVAEVTIGCEDRSADAASSLELMALKASSGMELRVSATGPDAKSAVRAVVDLVQAGFGELHAS